MDSSSPSERHNLGSLGHGDVNRNGDVETREERLRRLLDESDYADNVDREQHASAVLRMVGARA